MDVLRPRRDDFEVLVRALRSLAPARAAGEIRN